VRLIEEVVGARGRSGAITVQQFDGLIVNFAHEVGACVLVRGIRNELDFAYEHQMAVTNRRLAADIETVFLAADPNNAFLSSSLIKEIVKAGGSIAEFVPPNVVAALARK
jgi:pantetheine-phosphate adenylyltransferase